jgi:hypothetical protein
MVAGPTRTKSYYEDDLVVCVLRGGCSRLEQTPLEGGRGASVIQRHLEFQELKGWSSPRPPPGHPWPPD